MQEWIPTVIVGILATIGAIFGPILLEKLKHKNKKIDRTEEANISDIRKDIRDYKNETNEKIEEYKNETNGKIEKIENRITELTKTTDSLVKNEVARTYVNIRQQALEAIKHNKISAGTKEKLLSEYDRYMKLPNSNGFLKDIMDTVYRLPLVVDDEDLQ